MTLTDDQLTDAISTVSDAPTTPPAWDEVVDLGRRQRRSRLATAMVISLVAVGSLVAAVFTWSGDSGPLETAAPDHEIVVGTERPTGSAGSAAAPVTAESAQGRWRLMDINFGPGFESATQRLVVVIDEDFIRVNGSCLGLIVAADWQDSDVVGRRPNPTTPALSERLVYCPERALLTSISNFLTHGDPIEVVVEGDSLILQRAGLEVRAVRVPD